MITFIVSLVCLDLVLGSIQLEQGVLEGETLVTIGSKKSFSSFQGIPYAQPPVGELRFMPPQPHLGWKGVLRATNGTVKCPQKDAFFDDFAHGAEDCLVLNVYTPDIAHEKLPVMFWIHGGGFASGSGSANIFGPDYFMEENVVLVTVNYRLGALGFMNLEDELVSGNMGLKDVVMALKWVQNNIDKFGGDKDNVTIFGNNAGGATVSLLTQSSMAKGLFDKAICQSGVSKLPQLFGTKQRQRAFALAKALRKNPQDSKALLKAFEKIEPYDFVKAAPRTYDSTEARDAQKNVLPFGPSIEKIANETEAFLSENPKLENSNIPTMIGFNSAEAIVYLGKILNDPGILDKLNYNFQFLLPFRDVEFEYNSDTYNKVAQLIRNFYFKGGIIDKDSINEYVNYVSDGIFYPVSKTLSEHLESSSSPIYYYQFSHEGAMNYYKKSVLEDISKVSGASNGDEICYLFRCEALNEEYIKAHAQTTLDMDVIRKMVRMWTNFAKFGNPTPPDDGLLEGFQWRPATRDEHSYLQIKDGLKMDENPRSENVKFWDGIYETYSNKITQKDAKVEL